MSQTYRPITLRFRRKLCLLGVVMISACTTQQKSFDTSFSRSEIATFIADDFDTQSDATARALRPTYKKYGAPHAYISGFMSSVDDPTMSRLYGSGEHRSKTRLAGHTFWAINGEVLSGHLTPIRTAHLIYDTDRLENLTDVLSRVGSLSRKGKVFTVFERVTDGQVVVTLHRTDDLPIAATLQTLQFFDE